MPQRRPGIAKSIIFLFKAEAASPGLSNVLKEEEKALNCLLVTWNNNLQSQMSENWHLNLEYTYNRRLFIIKKEIPTHAMMNCSYIELSGLKSQKDKYRRSPLIRGTQSESKL